MDPLFPNIQNLSPMKWGWGEQKRQANPQATAPGVPAAAVQEPVVYHQG